MTTQAISEFISRHTVSSTALCALGAALDAHATGIPLHPAMKARIDELLGVLGARDVLEGVGPADVRPLLAQIRVAMLVEAKLLYHETRTIGWSHNEPHILQLGGDVSSGFVCGLANMVAPRLEGLSERLAAPGASFLDIGVGVAGLAVAMAQRWPQMRVVGIDIWKPSLALARDNVRNAGLADRIELREQAAEELPDTNAFDLVWMPTGFIPERVIPAALERALRALRPGGWLLFPIMNPGNDPQTAALVRLRTTIFGGGLMTTGEAEAVVRQAGFVDVKTLPGGPPIMALIVGRKMPDR